MAVLPESMDKLNVQDSPGSLSKIQEYIRYMGERIEFSFRNMTKTVSAAGVSSAELYILVQAQSQQLAALSSVLSGALGNITALQHSTAELTGRVTGLENDISDVRSDISALEDRVSSLEDRVSSLDERVSALETPEPEPDPEIPTD